MQSKGHTKGECQEQLLAASRGVQTWVARLPLQGHWIVSIHARQLGEVIFAQLFITGIPFSIGSIGAMLFQIKQRTKLLWSGISAEQRDQWKANLRAGELEDSGISHLIEQGGSLDACDFEETNLVFWQTASRSFLNIQSEKPVVILLNKSEAALENTTFWTIELTSLAMNPPSAKIRVITIQMGCFEIMQKLSDRVSYVAGSTRAAELRWSGIEDFTCETGSTYRKRYPPPLWHSDRLREHGLSASILKGLGYSVSWLTERGFPLVDLRNAGIPVSALMKEGISLTDLTEAGFPPVELKEAGVSAKDLKDAGFSAEALLGAGFSVKDLLNLGFSLAGCSPKLLKQGGSSAKDLKDMGVSAAELLNIGFLVRDLRDSGFSAEEARNAGGAPLDIYTYYKKGYNKNRHQ